MSELYGYVEDYIKSPLTSSTIVFGQWLSYNSLNLTLPFDFKIIQYRNFTIVGEWKLEAISNYTGKNAKVKQSLTLKPLHEGQYFMKDDLFFSNNLIVDFKYVNTNLGGNYNKKIALSKNNRYKMHYGLILLNENYHEILAIASKFPHDLTNNDSLNFKSINFDLLKMEQIHLKIVNNVISINKETPLEIKFDYDNMLYLKDYLDAVQPARTFIINASQEYHFERNLKKRNLRKKFEPGFFVKAGSVRTFLAPFDSDEQLELFLETDYGYKLLYTSLEYAEKRDSNSLISLLNANNLTNLKTYLNLLLKFSKTIKNIKELSIRYNDFAPLVLTNKAVSTINQSITEVKPANIEITGMLYAIDTRRNWFKVYDADNKLDWKFVYKNSDYNSELFKVNNFVKVIGETEIPIESSRGTATLKSIEPVEPPKGIVPEEYLKASDS